jgi:hypothetical protein
VREVQTKSTNSPAYFATNEANLLSAEMDFLKLTAKLTIKDKIPNHVIRKNMSLHNSILDYMKA